MRQTVERRFTKGIWNDKSSYEHLGSYLSSKGIEFKLKGRTFVGESGNVEVRVSLRPPETHSVDVIDNSTVMMMKVDIEDLSIPSQRQAASVLSLLSRYQPEYLEI